MSEYTDAEVNFGTEGGVTLTPSSPVEVRHQGFTRAPASTVSEQDLLDDGGNSNARMNNIVAMMNDPEAALADISRLIALEIAAVISLMNEIDPARRRNRSFKDLNDHVKALRELQRTLTEADSLSKRDVLNVDGPKFRFLYAKILEFFMRSLKDNNIDEAVAKQVMHAFGDLIKENDESVRRELNKIEMGR